jgi:hypothetical protein
MQIKKKFFSFALGVWARRAGDGTRLSRDKVTRERDPRGTPKTPVFGLPKSRPSPLQKTPFFALSEAKSVHF